MNFKTDFNHYFSRCCGTFIASVIFVKDRCINIEKKKHQFYLCQKSKRIYVLL